MPGVLWQRRRGSKSDDDEGAMHWLLSQAGEGEHHLLTCDGWPYSYECEEPEKSDDEPEDDEKAVRTMLSQQQLSSG
jgi:hypothetical protein